MPRHLRLSSAKSEVADARDRHIKLLKKIWAHCIEANDSKDGFLYLLAVPLIYAAWEGYFRIACAICLKRKYISTQKAKKYPSEFSALWLQKEGFIQSYLQKLINSMQPGKAHRPSGAQYLALGALSSEMAAWLDAPIGLAPSFDELVMTFSNVNRDVLKLNAGAIGIDINGINMGRLDELVGRRNDVAHGGLLTYPTEDEVNGLLVYAERLICSFDAAVTEWLKNS